jgi:hypothetical protein
MPIPRIAPPKQSLAKLGRALHHHISLKEKHKNWMKFLPLSIVARQVIYGHPLYTVGLTGLLEGKPLHAVIRRTGWIYLLRDQKKNFACAEVSSIRGVHKNARLTEGPFVRRVFELISKSSRDPRIKRRRFEMRSIRAESLHFFCLWFREAGGIEYFVPVTPLGTALQAKRWVSRVELTEALRRETLRVREANARAASLPRNVGTVQP